MSFTDEIKNEILSVWQKRPCCALSEAYGMVLILRQDGEIIYRTNNLHCARHLRKLLKKTAGIDVEISEIGAKYLIETSAEKLKIPSKISDDIFKCDGCVSAFFRGAFLACGNCSTPEKEYNLSFALNDELMAHELCELLKKCEFAASIRIKAMKSGNKYVVYIKKRRCIEDFLTLIGAQNSTLKIMQCNVMKDVRNNVNRKTNFEAANIIKSSASAAIQLEAIKKINESSDINLLPDELREVAIARLNNPELPLSEIGKLCGLSRSGVHHRLQKLIKISENMK